MPTILYSVRVTCPTLHLRGRFLSWLVPEHVLQIREHGATAARVVLLDRANDTSPAIAETQYVFPSRHAYDTYIREHAPAMRADVQKHFPPECGLTFERQVAEVAAEM